MSSSTSTSEGQSQWNAAHIPGFDTNIDAEAKYDNAEMYDALVPSELPHVICDVPVFYDSVQAKYDSLIDVQFCESRELQQVPLPSDDEGNPLAFTRVEIVSVQNQSLVKENLFDTNNWSATNTRGLYSNLAQPETGEQFFKLKISTDVIIKFYNTPAGDTVESELSGFEQKLFARPQIEVSKVELTDLVAGNLKEQLGTKASMSYHNRENVHIEGNENKVIFEMQEPVQEHNRGSFPTEHISTSYMEASEKNLGGLMMMVAATPLLGSKATTATPWDAKSIGFNNTGEDHSNAINYTLADWNSTTESTRRGESIVGKFVNEFKAKVDNVSNITPPKDNSDLEAIARQQDRSELANQIAKQGVYGKMQYRSESDNVAAIRYYKDMSVRRGYILSDSDGEENITVFKVSSAFVDTGSNHTAMLKITERDGSRGDLGQKEFSLDKNLTLNDPNSEYQIVKSGLVSGNVYFAILHKVAGGAHATYVEPVSSANISEVSSEFTGSFVKVHGELSNLNNQTAFKYKINGTKLIPDGTEEADVLQKGWFPYRDIKGGSDQYKGLLEMVNNKGKITYEEDEKASFSGDEYEYFGEGMESTADTPVKGNDTSIPNFSNDLKSYNWHYIESVRQFERARQIAQDLLASDAPKLKLVLEAKLKISTSLIQNEGDSFMHRGKVTFTIPDEIDIRNLRVDVLKELLSELWIDGEKALEKDNTASYPFGVDDTADGKLSVTSGGNFRSIKYSVPVLIRYIATQE